MQYLCVMLICMLCRYICVIRYVCSVSMYVLCDMYVMLVCICYAICMCYVGMYMLCRYVYVMRYVCYVGMYVGLPACCSNSNGHPWLTEFEQSHFDQVRSCGSSNSVICFKQFHFG